MHCGALVISCFHCVIHQYCESYICSCYIMYLTTKPPAEVFFPNFVLPTNNTCRTSYHVCLLHYSYCERVGLFVGLNGQSIGCNVTYLNNKPLCWKNHNSSIVSAYHRTVLAIKMYRCIRIKQHCYNYKRLKRDKIIVLNPFEL